MPANRSGLIATLIGGALVLGALALLLLRGGTTTIAPTVVAGASPSAATAEAPVPVSVPAPQAGAPGDGRVAPPAAPPVAVTVTPSVTNPPALAEKPLFASGDLPAPLAAWSTRRLVAAYNGPLLRVRRSDDHTERDIGFTSSGSLDSAALLLFVSRSTAHVVTWYDQSGNNHHQHQPERDKQPRIVINGTLEVENARPVVIFDRTRFEHFTTPAGIVLGSIYAVIKVRSYGDGAQGLMGSLAQNSASSDAYYPIVDRDRRGECEWWVGQQEGYQVLRTRIPRDRLLLWNSATDGQKRPWIQLRLDGVEVGSLLCNSDTLVPIGPTALGCLYWNHRLADPFGGSLGECFVIRSGLASSLRDLITNDMKRWWKTP
jgi:hypothetical protein